MSFPEDVPSPPYQPTPADPLLATLCFAVVGENGRGSESAIPYRPCTFCSLVDSLTIA